MFSSFLFRAIIGTCQPQTAPLQGLRVLTCFIVVIGHSYFWTSLLFDSSSEYLQTLRSNVFGRTLHFAIYSSMLLSIDVFFFISGFLFMSSMHARFLKDTGRISLSSVLQYLASRWLRLFPLYAIIFVLMKAAGGPRCTSYFELTLLKRSNPDRMCVPTVWSTLADFQLQLFISLFFACLPSLQLVRPAMWVLALISGLYRFRKWIDAGSPSLPSSSHVLDAISSRSVLIATAKVLRLPPSNYDPTLPQHEERHYFSKAYLPFYYFPELRVSAMFIGVAVWLSMREKGIFARVVRKHPLTSWMIGLTFVAFYFVGSSDGYQNRILLSIYEGFGRILVDIAIGIYTVLTCSVDKSTKLPCQRWLQIIRKLLGAKPFVIFARSTYAVYMIQLLTAFALGTNYPRITNEKFGSFTVALAGVKWYIVTVFAAIPFCIFEEACMVLRRNLNQFLFDQKRRELNDEVRVAKKL